MSFEFDKDTMGTAVGQWMVRHGVSVEIGLRPATEEEIDEENADEEDVLLSKLVISTDAGETIWPMTLGSGTNDVITQVLHAFVTLKTYCAIRNTSKDAVVLREEGAWDESMYNRISGHFRDLITILGDKACEDLVETLSDRRIVNGKITPFSRYDDQDGRKYTDEEIESHVERHKKRT